MQSGDPHHAQGERVVADQQQPPAVRLDTVPGPVQQPQTRTVEERDVPQIDRDVWGLAPGRGIPQKPLRMMILGIPNVGKSTLMNALLKKRVAKVGDEPAVTKQQQKLYLDKNTVLVDTPGMLWPKIALPSDGLMLAASHAIGSNALIEEEVAEFLAGELLVHYPELLVARYGFKEIEKFDAIGVVEGVGIKRGFRQKGGDLDYEKSAHTFLGDYRSGVLGRISLETPETRKVRLEVHAEEMAKKAAEKAAIAEEKAKAAARGKRGT